MRTLDAILAVLHAYGGPVRAGLLESELRRRADHLHLDLNRGVSHHLQTLKHRGQVAVSGGKGLGGFQWRLTQAELQRKDLCR